MRQNPGLDLGSLLTVAGLGLGAWFLFRSSGGAPSLVSQWFGAALPVGAPTSSLPLGAPTLAPAERGLSGTLLYSDHTVTGRVRAGNLWALAPGGTKTQLTTTGLNLQASWAHSGHWIVYTQDFNIWLMRPDGSGKRQLTATGMDTLPSFSPDDTRIIFTSLRTGNAEVWAMGADGTSPVRLTQTTQGGVTRNGTPVLWSSAGTFSPDGQRIVFASTRSGGTQIWIMDADGARPTQLTFPYGAVSPDANAPSWSPDGQWIAFWSGFETEYGDVWIMRADGSGRKQLTFDGGDIVFDPARTMNSDNCLWTPDGQSVYYESDRQPADLTDRMTRVWIVPAAGGTPRLLLPFPATMGRWPWLP